MGLIILITYILLLDRYIYGKTKTHFRSITPKSRLIVTVFFWLITGVVLLYVVSSYLYDVKKYNKLLFTYGRAIILTLYVSKTLTALPFLLKDIYVFVQNTWSRINNGPVIDLGRKQFLANISLWAGALPFGVLSYGMARNAYRYTLFNHQIPIKNLPSALEGLKIVQISDIHAGSFTFKEPVKNAVEMINRQKPDLVLFTGDLVNEVVDEIYDYIDVFSQVRAKYGVYSVRGNHDYGEYTTWSNEAAHQDHQQRMIAAHEQLGWTLLRNENRVLDINGAKVAVVGVENYSIVAHFPQYGDLQKAYQGAESAALKLLLSHDPSHWRAEVTETFKDIDLTFSGHTHGMQFGVEIPGWIKWSPIKFIYKEWAGLYREKEQYLHVNRGLGFIDYPGRVGILPEITVIELVSA